MSNTRLSPSPEHITGVFTAWLVQEISNANRGRNALLSNYEERRRDLAKSFDDQSNVPAHKAKSHHDRFISWITAYKEPGLKNSDPLTARLIFACLMNISGGYRTQCLLEAVDAAGYTRRREQQPVGVDMLTVVAEELTLDKLAAVASMSEDERLDAIIGRSLAANTTALDLYKSIYLPATRPEESKDNWTPGSDSQTIATKKIQTMWTGLAAAHVVVAASFRNDKYAAVPFLEPMSITDTQGCIYPLSNG
jgi:hypothetical protein